MFSISIVFYDEVVLNIQHTCTKTDPFWWFLINISLILFSILKARFRSLSVDRLKLSEEEETNQKF